MLSIQAKGGGEGEYYLSSVAEGYYLSDSQSITWLGEGAAKLGLRGEVRSEDFRKVYVGFDQSGRRLVQNAGKADRQSGWDLTFSMPKSAAVVWAVSDENNRADIERAHLAGVKAALGYLERTAAFTRVGKGGYVHERAGLVTAAFHHATSRLGDPGPHTHCVTMNVGVRDGGATGSLVSKNFYLAKMAAGAVYQAKLAAELERLGVRTEATKSEKGRFLGTFEVPGVPRAVCDYFSKRRQDIEAALQARGQASAAASAAATLATRPGKSPLLPPDEIFPRWKSESAERGFGDDKARAVFGAKRTVDELAVTRAAIEGAKKDLTDSVSHFTERELFRAAVVRTIGQGVDPLLVEKAVSSHLETSGDVVHLGGFRDAQHFTTKEVWAKEADLLAAAKGLADRTVSGLSKRTIEAHAEKPYRPDPKRAAFTLKPEQKEAVRALTGEGGSLRILSGYAGTGKTAVLRAVREAYERDGYKVLGASVAGAAAEQLEKGSGIRSDTVAMRFLEMNRSRGLGRSVWHHAQQVLKTAANTLHGDLHLPVYKLRAPLVIDKKTVLVVDEAGMLGTKDLERVVRAVKDGGGLVILVGDHRQLPPIPAGGGFRGLSERFGYSELQDITRQKTGWGRSKTRDLAEGLAEKVLTEAAERKLVTVGRDRADAVARVVADWSAGGVRDPKEHVMVATTNADVLALNALAQKERQRAGVVAQSPVYVNGYGVCQGDRIVFRENSRSLGVKNGTFGTVVKAGGHTLAVRPDGEGPDGKPKQLVTVNVRGYTKLELGYAVTAFRSQGATFDASYLLLGGVGSSRQMAYVVGSRERDTVRFYTDRFEAGHTLEKLSRGEKAQGAMKSPLAESLAKSAEKSLAHDVHRNQRSGPQAGPGQHLTREL